MSSSDVDSTSKYLVSAGGGITFALLVAALLIQFMTLDQIEGSFDQLAANHAADKLANQLNRIQMQVRQRFESAANDRELQEVLAQRNSELLGVYEKEIRQRMPDLLELRIIPLGSANVDLSAKYPFSYSAIDMVNRAETGNNPYPEAIVMGDSFILTIAQSIKQGPSVIGTLYGYLPITVVTTALQFDDSQGQLNLIQQFGNSKPVRLISLGSETPDSITLQRTLTTPHWRLELRASKVAGTQTGINPLFLWIPLLAFYFIAVIAGVVSVFLLGRQFSQQARLLAKQVREAFNGTHSTNSSITIPVLVELDTLLGTQEVSRSTQIQPASKDMTDAIAEISAAKVIDIQMMDEVEELGGSDSIEDHAVEEINDISAIFRAYDIRGIVNEELTPDSIFNIGRAIGTLLLSRGERNILVGMDGRVSSPAVSESLIDGLLDTGACVINLGMVPTPVIYFAIHHEEVSSAVVVTASHNPAEYNGFKIIIGGVTLTAEGIDQVRSIYESAGFVSGKGTLSDAHVLDDYVDAICDDVVVAQPLNIVIDCGNGVAGEIAPDLFSNLGCEVTPLYCEVDGDFPNHEPDPSVPANLEDLILAVTSSGADLGIAFDGDGSRMVAITNAGNIVWPDRLLMLFARDIVSRNPGSDVVYDIKSTRYLNSVISGFGGRPILCRSGHSYLKAKMEETGALLGGELSGHICIKERWYGFDDGLYSAARLLEIIGAQTRSLEDLIAEFPRGASTAEIKVPIPEGEKFDFILQLENIADFGDGSVNDLDGIRVDYPNGWGLVRASNTMPFLTLRFEADDDAELQRIKDIFKDQMLSIDGNLQLDF